MGERGRIYVVLISQGCIERRSKTDGRRERSRSTKRVGIANSSKCTTARTVLMSKIILSGKIERASKANSREGADGAVSEGMSRERIDIDNHPLEWSCQLLLVAISRTKGGCY